MAPATFATAKPLAFALIVHGAHILHLNLENSLHSLLDLYLVGPPIHLEGQLIVHLFYYRALFSNQWSFDNLVGIFPNSPGAKRAQR